MTEIANYGTRQRAPYLRRLDAAQHDRLESVFARALDNADAAVCVYDGEERHQRRDDYRRHGFVVHGAVFELFYCVE